MFPDLLPATFEFTTKNLLFEFVRSSLANVPFHENSPAISRLVADKFPLHLAVHQISQLSQPPAPYTFPHLHEEEDEINILLSAGLLKYSIMLADEYHIVTANSSIYIPRGMVHSANVLEGAGFFITLRF